MTWTSAFESIREVLDTKLFEIGDTPVAVSTLVTALLMVFVTLIASRVIRRAVGRALQRRVSHEGTIGAINKLVHYVVLSVGISIGLQTIGINLTALFAAGAVFAVGIGFAMKNIAENFVSGVILLVERSIRPGDVVAIEGRVVKVMQMGIRATIVQTRDAEDIIVPNSILVQSAVTSYTLNEPVYRTKVPVGVVYASDMRLVMDTLLAAARQAARDIPEVAADRDPEVMLVEFGDNAVCFDVALWVTDAWRLASIRSRIAQAIWWALKEQDIVIAFPQLDVHFDEPVARGLQSLASRAA